MYEGTILQRIYNQIAKADIIVSDMTGKNPNVFYETGYAHALNKQVILLTQNKEDALAITIIAPIVAFVLTLLLGSGVIWQWQTTKIAKLKSQLEANKLELEKIGTELAVIKASSEIRKELDELMYKIIQTTQDAEALDLCNSASYENKLKAQRLNARNKLYKENFQNLESQLANIEKREIRNINLKMSPPCPPTNVSVQ
jgi:hypothetical protein